MNWSFTSNYPSVIYVGFKSPLNLRFNFMSRDEISGKRCALKTRNPGSFILFLRLVSRCRPRCCDEQMK